MVRDSLHIICGNCGSLLTIGNRNNEKARASIDRDDEGNLDNVTITCENCDTVHFLSNIWKFLD